MGTAVLDRRRAEQRRAPGRQRRQPAGRRTAWRDRATDLSLAGLLIVLALPMAAVTVALLAARPADWPLEAALSAAVLVGLLALVGYLLAVPLEDEQQPES